MGLVIFPYIYHTNQLNVGKYTIHGSYGYYVDGSEIVEVGSLSHCLQGFKNIPGGWCCDFWTINSMKKMVRLQRLSISYFINLDFYEIRGISRNLSYLSGWKNLWGRYTLTRVGRSCWNIIPTIDAVDGDFDLIFLELRPRIQSWRIKLCFRILHPKNLDSWWWRANIRRGG